MAIIRQIAWSARRWAITWLGLLVFVSVVWLVCEGIELIGRVV